MFCPESNFPYKSLSVWARAAPCCRSSLTAALTHRSSRLAQPCLCMFVCESVYIYVCVCVCGEAQVAAEAQLHSRDSSASLSLSPPTRDFVYGYTAWIFSLVSTAVHQWTRAAGNPPHRRKQQSGGEWCTLIRQRRLRGLNPSDPFPNPCP